MKMKSITFSYYTSKTVTIEYKNLSPKDKKFIQAWLKDDDDRTWEDWDLVEKNDLTNLIHKYTNDNSIYEVEIESID